MKFQPSINGFHFRLSNFNITLNGHSPNIIKYALTLSLLQFARRINLKRRSIKIMLSRRFCSDLSLNKVHIRTELFGSLFFISLISHKIRNTLICFTKNRILDFHVFSLIGFEPFSLDSFDLLIEFSNTGGSFFSSLEEVKDRILIRLASSAGISLIGLSFFEPNLGISKTLLITHCLSFREGHNRTILRGIIITAGRGIRTIRGTHRTSNTRTTGRITINSLGSDTSTAPTGDGVNRGVIRILLTPSFLLILELLLHILQIVFLLFGHLFLTIAPVATGLLFAKESRTETRRSIRKRGGSKSTRKFC